MNNTKNKTGFSRRNFLKTMAAATAVPALGSLSNVAFAANGQADHTVVTVFLRGAMDGLSAVIPWKEDAYYDARPTIHIPSDGRHYLTSDFAINTALSPLRSLFRDGDLAFVVAAGLGPNVSTRSHFAAQRRMESGSDNTLQADGWMGRYLSAKADSGDVFRAVSMGRVTKSLSGFDASIGIKNLSELKIKATGTNADSVPDTIKALYKATDHSVLTSGGVNTIEALELAEAKSLGTASQSSAYGTSDVGDSMHEVAELINANVGLEAATVDMGGWDFHRGMGHYKTGDQALHFQDLGKALSAFYNAISANRNNVTVVVMSEFGRRVAENSTDGADHGKGGVMMVLGGGIAGGKVYGDWQGLATGGTDSGDVKVTTDYRQVLAELVDRRLGRSDLLTTTFPDYSSGDYLGIFG